MRRVLFLEKVLSVIVAVLVICFSVLIYISENTTKLFAFAESVKVYQDNGSYYQKVKEADIVSYMFISGKTGESCEIEKGYTLTEIMEILEFEMKIEERTEYGVSYYGYSKHNKYRKEIKGELINTQIYIGSKESGEAIKVGFPIIYGGY